MIKHLSFFILSLLIFHGCARDSDNPRLIHVSNIVSSSPTDALAALDSIDYGSLRASDRHFYDFLSVKARDKAYIEHSSDSLILDVLAYYDGHKIYPEALYYAGRVYSDMGDYPSALEYFQNSLDNITDDSAEMIELKGRVLSQTGRLLNRLRLYDRAIPYLREALVVDSILEDTFSLAYDNELLGAVYRHKRELQKAENSFERASRWAQSLTDRDVANMQKHLAITKLYQGDTLAALSLIRGVPDRVRPIQRNEALIYASTIFRAAGLPDSAYAYADRLVHSPDHNNRKSGYRNLFSPELFDMIPSDSVPLFVRDYHSSLESYYNEHDAQRAMMQDAFYNYQLHQRERQKAESRSRHTLHVSIALMFVILVLAIIILYLRYRRKTLLLRLHNAIHEIGLLRESLSSENDAADAVVDNRPAQPASELDVLRARLLRQIHLLEEQSEGKPSADSAFLKSKMARTLSQYVADNKPIPDRSPIWDELEQNVLSESPHFRDHLLLLAGAKLKNQDYRVALLIRCGVSPSQMTILLGCTKGTISYRRRHLCELIMGDSSAGLSIDSIIRCI